MQISDIPDDLAEILAWPYDFNIKDVPADAIWFSVTPETPLTAIATDGAGGVFVCMNNTEEILYVDSEGGAAIIAPNLRTLILLVVRHPYWRDLLKFSGGGRMSEIRKTLPFAAGDFLESEPNYKTQSKMIGDRLQLNEDKDLIDILYASVDSTKSKIRVLARDGSELDSLFYSFKATDNPMWRKKAL